MPRGGNSTARGYGYQWRQLCELAYRTYGYWCYYCDEPIDPTLPRTNPYARSVDHLKPIATHGAALPDLSDVRPMHRRCNVIKGNKARGMTGTASNAW